MKKKIIAFVIVLALSLSFLVGCGLVVENQKRDYEQVVATVGDTNIRKSELASAVANYAPQYVQNYGLTVKEAVDLILEQLIRRELQVQEATKACAIDGKEVTEFIILNRETSSSKVAKELKAKIEKMSVCFDEEGMRKIESTAWTDIKAVIESFENEVLAGDKNLTLTKEEKQAQIDELLNNPFEDRQARPSFKEEDKEIEDYPVLFFKEKVYNNLTQEDTGVNYPVVDENGKAVDSVEAEAYEMFIRKIESISETSVQEFLLQAISEYMEEELLNQYQDMIEAEATADLNDPDKIMDSITKAYKNMIAQQNEVYQIDLDAFDTYISSEDRDTLSIYNAKGGYAEVKNLLIMFDGDTKSIVSNLKNKYADEEAYLKARDLYAGKLELKDLRQTKKLNPSFNVNLKQTDKDKDDSWYVSSNYVQGANDRFVPADEVESFIPLESKDWKFSVAETVADGVSFDRLKNYIADSMRVIAGEDAQNTWDAGVLNYEAKADEAIDKSLDKYEDAFIDLLYKFNEDPGMFGKTNPNYMVNVMYQVGSSSKYVKEFQQACEDLINNAIKNVDPETLSINSLALEDRISIAVTDYGIHVILLTNVFFKDEVTNAPNIADLEIENTVTYNLAKLIRQNAASKAYSNKVESIYNEAKANGEFEIFPKVFADFSKM